MNRAPRQSAQLWLPPFGRGGRGGRVRYPAEANTREIATNRRGLTLYEVVLSIAILLPAIAVISQGLSAGSRAAVSTRLQTEAVLRCDSLMSEVIAGVVPMTAVTASSFDDGEPGWTWSLEVGQGPHPDLLAIQVTVEHTMADGSVNAMASLGRFTRDPQIFVDAALAAPMGTGSSSGATSGTGTGTETGVTR